MFIMANFLKAISTVLDMILTVYMWMVIARALISWVNPDPYNPIVRFLYNVTDPITYWIKKMIPFNFGPIDFAPMLLILVIIFLRIFIVDSLNQLAIQLAF